MLIEHRAYTLQLGATGLFWDAQRERGEDGLRPILERLIGSFESRTGPIDQVVSLYRYDSFDDWQARLQGVYRETRLQPYFRVVRPVIVRQESKFLVPAPLPELTPCWGNGNDWLSRQGPLLPASRGQDIFEQTTLTFAAGGVPACWEAYRKHALGGDGIAVQGLLGAFSSIVGSLNEVLLYRHFTSVEALFEHRAQRERSAPWTSWLRTLAPLMVASDSRLLAPSRIPDMSPLYGAV